MLTIAPIRVVDVRSFRTPEQRAGVCYVGRAFAGWPESYWGNPFKPAAKRQWAKDVAMCLDLFRDWMEVQEPGWFEYLWEACGHGAKPLGCWCINATHGDGQAVICHAQILAAELHKRFVEGAVPA